MVVFQNRSLFLQPVNWMNWPPRIPFVNGGLQLILAVCVLVASWPSCGPVCACSTPASDQCTVGQAKSIATPQAKCACCVTEEGSPATSCCCIPEESPAPTDNDLSTCKCPKLSPPTPDPTAPPTMAGNSTGTELAATNVAGLTFPLDLVGHSRKNCRPPTTANVPPIDLVISLSRLTC